MDYGEKIRKILVKLPRKCQVAFALKCANDVKHLMEDARSLKTLEITEKWLRGEATKKEIEEATHSASTAAYAAAYTVTLSGTSSATPTNAVDWSAKAQNIDIKHYYDKLLNSLIELERALYES